MRFCLYLKVYRTRRPEPGMLPFWGRRETIMRLEEAQYSLKWPLNFKAVKAPIEDICSK